MKTLRIVYVIVTILGSLSIFLFMSVSISGDDIAFTKLTNMDTTLGSIILFATGISVCFFLSVNISLCIFRGRFMISAGELERKEYEIREKEAKLDYNLRMVGKQLLTELQGLDIDN